ncbi:unnamed protein product, partial [Polarella glacialis]
ARVWGLETLDPMRMLAATLQVAGGVLTGLEPPPTEGGRALQDAASGKFFHGVSLLIIAMVLSSQRWALIQHVVQKSPRGSALAGMSKLELTAWIMPVTSAVCLSMAFVFEAEALSMAIFSPGLLGTALVVATGIGILTVAEIFLVQVTSAVAMQVLSTLHQIPIVLAGVLLFKDTIGLNAASGFGLSLAGGLCYVAARHTAAPHMTPAVAEWRGARQQRHERVATGEQGIELEAAESLDVPACVIGVPVEWSDRTAGFSPP